MPTFISTRVVLRSTPPLPPVVGLIPSLPWHPWGLGHDSCKITSPLVVVDIRRGHSMLSGFWLVWFPHPRNLAGKVFQPVTGGSVKHLCVTFARYNVAGTCSALPRNPHGARITCMFQDGALQARAFTTRPSVGRWKVVLFVLQSACCSRRLHAGDPSPARFDVPRLSHNLSQQRIRCEMGNVNSPLCVKEGRHLGIVPSMGLLLVRPFHVMPSRDMH